MAAAQVIEPVVLALGIDGGGSNVLKAVVAASFVLVYSATRFNTPPTCRSSTTALRYHTAAMAYAFVGLLLFWVLTASPTVAASLLKGTKIELSWLKDTLLVALLVTVLLPELPVLRQLEAQLRGKLHQMAAIPAEVRRLTNVLKQSRWEVPKNQIEELQGRMGERGLPLDVERRSMCYLWTKLSSLMITLERWSAQPRVASFLFSFQEDYDRIKEGYALIERRAARLVDRDRKRAMAIADPHGEMTFKEDCAELLNQIYTLISRGVLRCRATERSRTEALKAAGFSFEESVFSSLTYNHYAALLLALTGVFSLVFLTYATTGPQQELSKVVMVPVIIVTAVACAIVPKAWFKGARWDGGMRPYAAYIASGIAAVVLGAIVSMPFRCFMSPDPIQHFLDNSAWLVVTFVATVVMSFHADNRPNTWGSRLREKECGITAAALATASSVPINFIESLPGPFIVAPTCAVVGAVLGGLVPHWYRESAKRNASAPVDRQYDAALDEDEIPIRVAG